MVRYYVACHHPEVLLKVNDKDDRDARYKAALQLTRLINAGHIPALISNGFSTQELIEITREDLMPENEKIISAVTSLSKLSYAKQKVQEQHAQAQDARQSIDILFSDQELTLEEFQIIRRNLQILKKFACANFNYKEAMVNAKNARIVLNEALETLS